MRIYVPTVFFEPDYPWAFISTGNHQCNFGYLITSTGATGFRADIRFASSQWETALLCNDVSHWLGVNLESALRLLGCRFHIMDNKSYFFVFWHMLLYMSWYIRSFFGFTFLNILNFFKYSCTYIFHRCSLYTFYWTDRQSKSNGKFLSAWYPNSLCYTSTLSKQAVQTGAINYRERGYVKTYKEPADPALSLGLARVFCIQMGGW